MRHITALFLCFVSVVPCAIVACSSDADTKPSVTNPTPDAATTADANTPPPASTGDAGDAGPKACTEQAQKGSPVALEGGGDETIPDANATIADGVYVLVKAVQYGKPAGTALGATYTVTMTFESGRYAFVTVGDVPADGQLLLANEGGKVEMNDGALTLARDCPSTAKLEFAASRLTGGGVSLFTSNTSDDRVEYFFEKSQ